MNRNRILAGDSGPSAGFFLLAVAWFGVLSGLIEVAILAVRRFYFHEIFLISPDFVWMVPVGASITLAVSGLLLSVLLLLRRRPTWVAVRIVTLSARGGRWRITFSFTQTHAVVFALAFLGVLTPLFALPTLDSRASLLLATGVAVQSARLVGARPAAFAAMARRTLVWMVALVLALGVGTWSREKLAERRQLAQLPQAPAGAPNILLLVLDTVRAKSLSLHGYQRPTTPQMERLATRGVVFDRAFSTSPWTLPAHASMFTGRFPHEHHADWLTPLDATYPTLAERLAGRGYVTAGFVANTLYGSRVHGLDRGFIHYEDFPVSLGQLVINFSLGRKVANREWLRRLLRSDKVLNRDTAAQTRTAFLRWLPRKQSRPFFAFINFFDAHEPYLPPQPFDTAFGPRRQTGQFVHTAVDAFRLRSDRMSPEARQTELNAYEGTIAYMDEQIALLCDELARRGLLQNTLLIVTSDHGEQQGEHDLFSHGNSLYLPLLHVPLLIVFPGRAPAGLRVHEPVSLRALPTTILDLIGLSDPVTFPGSSLAGYWNRGSDNNRLASEVVLAEASRHEFGQARWYPLMKGNMRSLVSGRYHYIVNGDGSEELYDFESDPDETKNLAGVTTLSQLISRFRIELQSMRAAHNR